MRKDAKEGCGGRNGRQPTNLHDGTPLFRELLDHVHHHPGCRRIQTRRWLIEEDELWVRRQFNRCRFGKRMMSTSQQRFMMNGCKHGRKAGQGGKEEKEEREESAKGRKTEEYIPIFKRFRSSTERPRVPPDTILSSMLRSSISSRIVSTNSIFSS